MRYEIDDNEVLDHQTGLIWQRAIAENLTFDQAVEYAERVARETGLAWRLPTKDELAGLVDRSRCSPASAFPDMPGLCFWSSSLVNAYTCNAWEVNFNDGAVGNSYRNWDYAVRLVRGGICLPSERASGKKRGNNLEFSHYALIQAGCAVFAVGETEDECRNDAAEWLDQDDADQVEAFASMTAMRQNVADGDMAIVPCTEGFCAYVRQHGTTTWDETDGGICLPSELAEE